ncbi:S1/P1 nuclease [Zunongwangia endophytica]|uniref:S1/P1 nuclease n=1 Tax=Zunongwangia endophytica TaxID=1808945 RepID=A0ABV8H9M4_9FLAO|nr:S1/P1 nuclease [Zunongwangia endophytica]MDN3594971.1 S1/P1 nuclease [Zunongwangia endophytica]
MKRVLIVLCVVLISNLSLANDIEWGKTGHRTTGEIAQVHLNRRAKKAIDKLLNGNSLAFVANHGDDIKSDPSYRKYSPWHYVNIDPEATEYDAEHASEDGDLVGGIRKCIEVLEDKNASREDKQFHLKMLVHFVGDLHQPFHVGHAADLGGNRVDVEWFGKKTNIHSVWDSKMIDSYQMSYTELAENRDELSKMQIKAIESGNLLDWVYESRDLAEELYKSVEEDNDLGYKYMYQWFPTVRQQLQKGGIRLAKILNEIYG